MNALRYSAISVIILAWAVAVFMGVSAAVLQSFGAADDNTSAAPAADPTPAAPAPDASTPDAPCVGELAAEITPAAQG